MDSISMPEVEVLMLVGGAIWWLMRQQSALKHEVTHRLANIEAAVLQPVGGGPPPMLATYVTRAEVSEDMRRHNDDLLTEIRGLRSDLREQIAGIERKSDERMAFVRDEFDRQKREHAAIREDMAYDGADYEPPMPRRRRPRRRRATGR